MSRSATTLLIAVGSAAVLTFAMTSIGYLNRPLRSDEADWPKQARAIVEHGVPRVSFEDDHVEHGGSFYGYDAHYGLHHPPLYTYVLAAAYALGGDRDWVYRSAGVLCLAATLLVIRSMAGQWLPAAIPLLSPLVVEGGVFLDIDNTTLLVSLALILWRFLRPGDPATATRIAELALLLCLAFWSKLTTPFLLVASLAAYSALGPQPWRRVGAVVTASAAGAALFAASYLTYCAVLDLPAAFMFDVSYVGKHHLYTSVKRLRDILFAVRWNVVWASPILLLLLATVTFHRIGRWRRERSVEPVDLLVIVSWATFACYALVGAMWGKYTVPAAVFGGAAVGMELGRAWPSLRIERPRPFAAVLALLAMAAVLLPVPYMRPSATDLTLGITTLVLDPRNAAAAATLALAGAFALVAPRWLASRGGSRRSEVALAACLAVFTLVTTARVVLVADDRGPLRPFTDRGFRDTVAWLNQAGGSTTAILAEKSFGRYFRGRVFPLDGLLAEGGIPAAVDAARRPAVRYIVDSSKYPLLTGAAMHGAVEIARIERIGDFIIYVKR